MQISFFEFLLSVHKIYELEQGLKLYKLWRPIIWRSEQARGFTEQPHQIFSNNIEHWTVIIKELTDLNNNYKKEAHYSNLR